MKKILMTAVALCGLAFVPALSNAAEPSRDRAAEASDVASFLGLENSEFRVLSEQEANEVRGTGGCFGGSLLGLTAKITANLNVKVLSNVKVNANVNVRVR